MTEDGPPPDELIQVRLITEFGWTISELDEQDEARALRLLAARNIEAAVRRVNEAVQSHQVNSVPASVWQLYKAASDAGDE